jgi:hypothetical protein
MTVPQEAGKVVTSITEGLRQQPLALALIVMNLVFVGFTLFIFWELNTRTVHQYETKDQLISKLIAGCGSQGGSH